MKKYIRIYYVEHTWRAELGWNDDSTRPPQSVHPSSSTTRLGTGNVTRVGTENELWIYWSFILYLYSRFSSLSLSLFVITSRRSLYIIQLTSLFFSDFKAPCLLAEQKERVVQHVKNVTLFTPITRPATTTARNISISFHFVVLFLNWTGNRMDKTRNQSRVETVD